MSDRRSERWHVAVLVVLLALFFVRAVHTASEKALTIDESQYVGTGLYLWESGDYDYVEDGDYLKVYVSIDGEATLVIGQETEIGDERVVAIWAVVVDVPDGFRHPPAMLRTIADLNGSMTVGNVGLYEGTVIYSSSFWLRGADDTILAYELTLAHYQRETLRAELKPFVEEGS